MFMINLIVGFILFVIMILGFTALGIIGAIAFEYAGDWVFNRLADFQEWQDSKK